MNRVHVRALAGLLRFRRAALFPALLVGLFVAGSPDAALADCEISLRGVRDVRFRGADEYDVFSASETAQTAYFEVRHRRQGDPCDYFITFSTGQAGNYDRHMLATEPLGYQIYDTASKSNVLKDLPEATASEVLSGTFGSDAATQEFSYYVAIPPGQIVPDDTYTDTVTLTLYEGTLTSYIERDSADVDITARVRDIIQMCVVGCGTPFDPFAKSRTLNFGMLQPGAMRDLDLLVRGNADYDVYFRSENRGELAHLTVPGSAVPYTMTVDGGAIDLSGGRVLVASGTGPTAAGGDRYRVEATAGSISLATAGDHRDVVEITVRTR